MTFDATNLSRREALAALGMLALSCKTSLAAGTEGSAAAKTPKNIALQLYTVRDQAKKDLAGTLKKVREIGFECVQWSGMPNLPAEKIRESLDAAGLKAIAAHVGVEAFEKNFDESVRFWKTVGVKDVAPGGMMNDCKKDLEGWLRGAKRLDTLGAKLREVGMRLSYHNHSWEFEKFPADPRCKIDILMEVTRPENLYSELDTAWAFHAGYDPAAFLRKYKGRFKCIHAKDIMKADKKGKAKLMPLGQGSEDWKDIFAAGHETGVEWFIYEQDNGEGSPFDYARQSFEFMAKNL
jgi:sugar phosphate isomerase/epimerase